METECESGHLVLQSTGKEEEEEEVGGERCVREAADRGSTGCKCCPSGLWATEMKGGHSCGPLTLLGGHHCPTICDHTPA